MASVKIKLKVPATQHHRRKRLAPAHWRANSNVRYLFGLALYIACWKKCGSSSIAFSLKIIRAKYYFSTIRQGKARPHTRVGDSGIHHISWMESVTVSTLQLWLSTFRFSPPRTPERCCPQNAIWVLWWSGQRRQNLDASAERGKVPVGCTCPRSMQAQSCRTAWRVRRK